MIIIKEVPVQLRAEIMFPLDPDESISFRDDCHIDRASDRLSGERHPLLKPVQTDKPGSGMPKLVLGHVDHRLLNRPEMLFLPLLFELFHKAAQRLLTRRLELLAPFCLLLVVQIRNRIDHFVGKIDDEVCEFLHHGDLKAGVHPMQEGVHHIGVREGGDKRRIVAIDPFEPFAAKLQLALEDLADFDLLHHRENLQLL